MFVWVWNGYVLKKTDLHHQNCIELHCLTWERCDVGGKPKSTKKIDWDWMLCCTSYKIVTPLVFISRLLLFPHKAFCRSFSDPVMLIDSCSFHTFTHLADFPLWYAIIRYYFILWTYTFLIKVLCVRYRKKRTSRQEGTGYAIILQW